MAEWVRDPKSGPTGEHQFVAGGHFRSQGKDAGNRQHVPTRATTKLGTIGFRAVKVWPALKRTP